MHKPLVLALLAAFACHAAYAQEPPLEIRYESPADFRLGITSNMDIWTWKSRRDVNGDDVPDLVTIRDDELGNPDEFAVFDVATAAQLAHIPYDALLDAFGGEAPSRFLGFFDFYGEGGPLKDAVFFRPGTVALLGMLEGGKQAAAKTAMAVTFPAGQAVVYDFDDDGLPELIIRNSDTRTVQVWGRVATGTATEDEIAATMARLFPNYPNPFRDATTIPYAVDQPGPVTLAVYDLLGRRVRTLVDEALPAGTYQAAWDGRDAAGRPVAAGTYLYRLRVGETLTGRQAIHVR